MAGEIDAVRVVDDAIEDGVGIGRIADQGVPFVDGDLAGNDRRSAAMAYAIELISYPCSEGGRLSDNGLL